jgi:peptidyl-prolyl cis-trans isomerase D
MLNIIRKNAQSAVIQAIVVIIAIVFIFWGVGTQLKNPSNALAVVNGQEIGYRDFQQTYERAVEQYKQQFGGQLPDKFLESVRLKEQVLEQLVQRELLRQGAEEMGLFISNEATQRKIQEIAAFSQNGRFDLEQYDKVLEQNRLSPAIFESGIRDDLLIDRVTELIGAFAEVSNAEVAHWMEFIDQEIRLAYTVIESADYQKKVEIAGEALNAWYEKHKRNYQTPSQIKLAYLPFALVEEAKLQGIDEKTVRHYYQEHLGDYQIPEQRRARHILLRVDENATADVKTAKKNEAKKILEQIRQGVDFAELAKKVSEDATREKGGDLGFFSRGQMVASFEQSAFALRPGEVSDVVESPFGFHVIKLEEIRPATTRSLEAVSPSIRKQLAQKAARTAAFAEASATYEAIIRAGSLAKFSEKGGAPILRTDFFAQDKPPKMPMVDDPAFLQAAFGLRKGELSSVIETASGYAILFVEQTKEPVVRELNAGRDRVTADYTKEKSAELARSAAEDYLRTAHETGKWPDGLEKKESAYIKRIGPSTGIPEIIRRDAFKRLGTGSFPEHVLNEGSSCFLYQILDSRTGKSELDAGARKNLEQQLLAGQKNLLIASWLGQLRKDSKVWINTKMIQ